jgi:beta-galactosidase/beta-glucuronidase
MMNNGIVELTENWLIEGFDSERGLAAKAYRKDYLPLQGVKTCIPSTVRNALLKEGHIADPYEGFNSETTKWVEKKEWWFFHDFPTPEYAGEQRVILTFEGITYRAEIWVNGIQADYIEGMFRVAEVDVTDYLDEKHNRLTLRIRAQENAFLDDRNSEGQNCVRTQAPVAQSMYRWNWCPHIVCIGIWQPVTLAVRNPIYIESVQIRTLSVETNGQDGNECSAADSVIGLKWTVVNRSSKPGNGRLAFCISGQSFHQENIINDTVHIAVEADSVCSFYKEVDMKNARLWWPNGLGDAELHQLETRLLDEHTNAVYDCSYDTFGIRKITFLANDDEAWVIKTSGHSTRPWSNVGEMYKWTFVINGRSVFLKGSNWVVTDSLLRLDRERYETQLNLVKTGGFNFLRVWGGSLAETREFYELCDQYGILCWQEFWLACGNYPAMRHDLFIQCVNDTVKRLINHPSLVYYSGGNEYEPDNKENNVLVDKIAAAVAEIDPEREFRRGSPYKGDKHGGLVMTPYVTRNKYLDILYGDARVVLFRSEVATGRSTPMLSSLEKMLPENKRWPMDDEYWRHFFAVPSEFKMFANEYDALDSFESAVFANYLVHSLICRYNMEYCRSQIS